MGLGGGGAGVGVGGGGGSFVLLGHHPEPAKSAATLSQVLGLRVQD